MRAKEFPRQRSHFRIRKPTMPGPHHRVELHGHAGFFQGGFEQYALVKRDQRVLIAVDDQKRGRRPDSHT